jgi:NAD(P)H-hydrate epimerase
VTFACRKPGHLLLPGRLHAGEVEVADIGIPESILGSLGCRTFANQPALWFSAFPRPALDTHKYRRGDVLVSCGPAAQTGAARLAARGALRIGAGLVTLATPTGALGINAAHSTAVMLRPCDEPDDYAVLLEDGRTNALVLGPGLGIGEQTRALVRMALGSGRDVVLDADALTSHAGEAPSLFRAIRESGRGVVLTPHEGEFERLFSGEDTVASARSKLDRARAAAERSGAVVVLKGPDTVIAAPDGQAAIGENGSPYLATAGSGDVLCGFIAGLQAQGMSAFEAACAGVWLHAEVGRRFGPGLIAEDLPEHLPAVLRDVLRRQAPLSPAS